MTLEAPIELANLTVRTYNLLKKLGCDTVGDVAQLSARDILYHDHSTHWVYEEVNTRLLDAVGLAPLDPNRPAQRLPAVPEVPHRTFGALCVQCGEPDGDTASAQVRQAVLEAAAAYGAHPVDLETLESSGEELDDDLVHIDVSTGRWSINRAPAEWIWVRSWNLELAPPGRNPLALRLSRRWPVVSVTSTEGAAYEVCVYRDGVPVQYAAHGRPANPPPVDVPLDFRWLAEHARIPVNEDELRAVFGHPDAFGNLTGLANLGARDEQTELFDLPEDAVVFLRRSRS